MRRSTASYPVLVPCQSEMASPLRLRESLHLGIRKIHALSDEAVEELRIALYDAGLKSHADDLSEEIAPLVHTISRDDVDEIVQTLFGLGRVATSADVPVETFVEDVCDSIAESKHKLDLVSDEKERLKARLATLLDNNAILVASKARLVFIEHEHYLCYARIMTDIRPVFGMDVDTKPMAAMVAHTLKLVYHEGRGKDTKEIFVALDPSSLDRLSELIERAKAKEATLKSVLGTADIRYIENE